MEATKQRPLRELSRFSAGGKTFFFNRGQAANGSDYLAINVLYGQGQQQRLTLFQDHFLPFYKHSRAAIEGIAEISFGGPQEVPAAPVAAPAVIPESCPQGHGYHCYRVFKDRHAAMHITCESCGEVVW